MPGIAGIVQSSSPEDQGRLVGHMAAALGVDPLPGAAQIAGHACASFTHVAAGCPNEGSGAATSNDGEVLAVVDGEIFEGPGAEDRGPVSHAPDGGRTAAHLALYAYLRHGDRFVEHLAGCFSVAIWDSRTQVLLLATDRMGLRPLYWSRTDRRTLFASTVRAILRAPELGVVDRHGLSDFIVFGFPLGTKTLFQQVERVPPGSLLVIRDGKPVEIRRYWRLNYETTIRSGLRLREATELFADAFTGAVKRLSDEPGCYAVPLSGGLDSRCILAAVLARGGAVRTFTIGSAESPDLLIGSQIAHLLRLPHQSWELTSSDFLAWLEDAVRVTDGMCNAFDMHALFLVRQLPQDTRAIIDGTSSLDGMYGYFDVMLNRRFGRAYPPFRQARWSFTKPLFNLRGELTEGGLFSDDFRAEAERYVRETLDEVISAVPEGETNPFNRTDILDLIHRLPRFNMMGTSLLRTRCEVRHPFLHPDVLAVVRQLPPEFRAKEKLIQCQMLALLAPQLNAVPWERTGLLPSAGLARVGLGYGTRLARRSLIRMIPRRLRGPVRTRGIGIDYGRWLASDPRLQGFVRDLLLSQRSLQRGYFEPQAVRRIVDAQFRGEADHRVILGKLITAELWHQLLLSR